MGGRNHTGIWQENLQKRKLGIPKRRRENNIKVCERSKMGKGGTSSCASGQEQVASPCEQNIKLQLTQNTKSLETVSLPLGFCSME